VVSAAVSFGMLHLAAAPLTRASAADSPLLASAPAAPSPARSDTPVAQDNSIREAYSDGGYQDWIQQQSAP
jgi:hypothetical protein